MRSKTVKTENNPQKLPQAPFWKIGNHYRNGPEGKASYECIAIKANYAILLSGNDLNIGSPIKFWMGQDGYYRGSWIEYNNPAEAITSGFIPIVKTVSTGKIFLGPTKAYSDTARYYRHGDFDSRYRYKTVGYIELRVDMSTGSISTTKHTL